MTWKTPVKRMKACSQRRVRTSQFLEHVPPRAPLEVCVADLRYSTGLSFGRSLLVCSKLVAV